MSAGNILSDQARRGVVAGLLFLPTIWLVASVSLPSAEESGSKAEDFRHMLARQPYSAHALQALATMAMQAGRKEEAFSLSKLSGSLSWRNSETQWMLIADAIERRDEQAALRHVDALLRRQPELGKALFPILHQASTVSSSRRFLIDSLLARPLWREAFLADLAPMTIAQAQGHAKILEALRAEGQLNLERELAPYIRWLTAQGFPAWARRMWTALAGGPDALLLDPEFLRLPAYKAVRFSSPFEWQTRRVSGVTVTREGISDRGSSRALVVRSIRPAFGTLLSQDLVLNPGRYRLVVQASSAEGSGLSAFHWNVRCLPQGAILPLTVSEKITEWQGEFSVPDQGCMSQRLSLSIRRMDGPSSSETKLHSVNLMSLTDGMEPNYGDR